MGKQAHQRPHPRQKPGARRAAAAPRWSALAILALAGCRSFAAVGPAELAPGEVVRTEVAGAAEGEAAPAAGEPAARGPAAAAALEGVVAWRTATELAVDVAVSSPLRGVRRVVVPLARVAGAEVERPSDLRTLLATLGGVVGLGATGFLAYWAWLCWASS